MKDLDIVNENSLYQSINFTNAFLDKNYLNNVHNLEVIEDCNELSDEYLSDNIRFYRLERIIYNKSENNIQKLMNIYSVLYSISSSYIMLINSKGSYCDVYLGVKRIDEDEYIVTNEETLFKSIKGNFPGVKLYKLSNEETYTLLRETTNDKLEEKNVAAVTGIPSLKGDNNTKFIQGIEKFIESMQGFKYTMICIAEPTNKSKIKSYINMYENLYTSLKPFSNMQLTINKGNSTSVCNTISNGITETINNAINLGNNTNTSFTDTETAGYNKTRNMFARAFNLLLGGKEGTNASTSSSYTKSEGFTFSASQSTGNSINKQKSSAYTDGYNESRGINISTEDKQIKNILNKIDMQLKRLEKSQNLGMWTVGTYFLSEDKSVIEIAANTFNGITRGNLSSVENNSIAIWDDDRCKQSNILKYLRVLENPKFNVKHMDVPSITYTSLLNTEELTIQLSLPQKSVSGVIVSNMEPFGRQVTSMSNNSHDKKVSLGSIYNMGCKEDIDVSLNVNSLAMHTFITGSTGAGKSNVIYNLLNKLNENGIRFLVIEPAKGEYKNIFGGLSNVNVFGTNETYTPLIKINPFKFPNGIHVLEHIDRLVEIFNACWPMYAAMPIILKEAIELSYIMNGWDIENSICLNNEKQYPDFNDVLRVLPQIIEESNYSEEVKGNYVGSLVTRIKSMTNGLIGKIFGQEDIDSKVLFDCNTIIDLSRISASETKSLIMGILFIKLQEYRLVTSKGENEKLKHVTVLEEAHNLLKKTSNSEDIEGVSIQGKSVETITNAIAEMRTYGEGFIIADQSPGLLDEGVLRNTNTKIILRLPNENDRQIVGKSVGLTKEQIVEVARLETGKAVVYQNDWFEPVLCEVALLNEKHKFKYKQSSNGINKKVVLGNLFKLILQGRISNKDKLNFTKSNIKDMNRLIDCKNINLYYKDILNKDLNLYVRKKSLVLWKEENYFILCNIVSELMGNKYIFLYLQSCNDIYIWHKRYLDLIRMYVDMNKKEEYEIALMQCILSKKAKEDERFKNLYFAWVEKLREGELR